MGFIFYNVENIVGKGENIVLQDFSIFHDILKSLTLGG